jgi:DNA-binding response OmpR family regulator
VQKGVFCGIILAIFGCYLGIPIGVRLALFKAGGRGDNMGKILIIEDEEDLAKVLKKRLSDSGFQALCAFNALEGVQLVKEENPDLVILDLKLPKGGGFSALANIRTLSKRYIPVVVITAVKNEAIKDAVLQKGVEAYLEKPFDFGELLKVVNNALSRPQKD